MSEIKNNELKLENIPKSLEDGGGYFSHTFNGYKYGGSFKGCAEISKKVRLAIKENRSENLNLSELRTSLFFYFRALRHGGDPEESRVNNLLKLIRERVEKGELE